MSFGVMSASSAAGKWWYDADGWLQRLVWTNGSEQWYQYGKRHRNGGLPALVSWTGYKAWYVHGKLHRSHDLPAEVWPDGSREWWVDGVCQTSEDRAQTRRWSALRAAFVGAVVAKGA